MEVKMSGPRVPSQYHGMGHLNVVQIAMLVSLENDEEFDSEFYED